MSSAERFLLAQHLVLRASTELNRSLNKFVIEFMNRRTKFGRICTVRGHTESTVVVPQNQSRSYLTCRCYAFDAHRVATNLSKAQYGKLGISTRYFYIIVFLETRSKTRLNRQNAKGAK